MLAPIVASIASLIVSPILLSLVVVPRIPTKAGKVINTVLFSLLSAVLSLVLGFAVVFRLL